MDEIQIEGHRIAYRRRGDGPPIVLLHGWPTNSREWARQLEGLSDAYTVVAWDAPGAGRSSDPPDGFTLGDWADCLAAFTDTLGLVRPHVAGLSWGGGLALELYRRHPAVPSTLILVGAYAGWGGSLPRETVERRLELMRRNTGLPPEQWTPALIDTLVTEQAPPSLRAELASILGELHPAATRVALEAFAAADLRDLLPHIEVPTLLIYGEQDTRAPREVWEPLRTAIPGAEMVLVPGVGHMVDMEGADRLNDEVRAFLTAHG